MSVYKILVDPDPVLRQKSLPVKNINAGILRVLENMRDTMYAADGVGLAGPQIGISKRIIVVDPGDNLLEIINPEIIDFEGERFGSEGCLSVPGKVGWLKRAQKIRVKGLNPKGESIELEATDMLAKVLQHEIDHLDGVLFPDKAIKIRTDSD
ncbi:MAG: peptide deformylase [Firmicutes bacterium HGW-Firmicutes-15]|nr:MAG: peptide deformylase [Firmicutes bacterium HGW-Firmicutes-15]